MTNIEYFDKVHNKGSLGKRIYNCNDDTLNLDIKIYLDELRKYIIRTKGYKKAKDKSEYIDYYINHYYDYYKMMNNK